MAKYASGDFLFWEEDVDLDEVLGEYTEDENASLLGNKQSLTCIYLCPDCGKEYKSISGFRGHVLKKHNRNLRASDHKKDSEKKSVTKTKSKAQFQIHDIFSCALTQTFKNIQCDPMYNIFGASAESSIAKACESEENVERYFESLMVQCFDSNTISSVVDRENFFKTVHRLRTDQKVVNAGVIVLQKIVNKSPKELNNFIQIVMLELIAELVKARLNYEKMQSQKDQSMISKTDNNILFYISGFIIKALEKRCNKFKSKQKREKIMLKIKGLLSTSSEKSFTEKYAKWFEMQNRGGLKKPCDKFFFLIREFERIVRNNTDKSEPSPQSFLKSELKENILESYMVKKYAEDLFSSENENDDENDWDQHQFLEDIMDIFLTVRGYASAKLVQKQYRKQSEEQTKAKSSASLRGALKCLSNK